jgi:hypothetical protein
MSTTKIMPAADYIRQESEKFHVKSYLVGAALTVVAFAIGAIVAAYFLDPSLHQLASRVLLQIQHGNISIANALLKIALPAAAGATVIGLCVHLHRKYQEKRACRLDELKMICLKQALREMRPSKKQVAKAAAAIGIIVLLALSAYIVTTHVNAINSYLAPKCVSALGYKIKLWQGLAGFGGGVVLAAIIADLGRRCVKKIQERKMNPDDAQVSEIFYEMNV